MKPYRIRTGAELAIHLAFNFMNVLLLGRLTQR
ncbi:MAG: hypothetical protein JWL86_982 [Rhizobium sp.]|nr:hypothetical protein [Rhizobium sp.]